MPTAVPSIDILYYVENSSCKILVKVSESLHDSRTRTLGKSMLSIEILRPTVPSTQHKRLVVLAGKVLPSQYPPLGRHRNQVPLLQTSTGSMTPEIDNTVH